MIKVIRVEVPQEDSGRRADFKEFEDALNDIGEDNIIEIIGIDITNDKGQCFTMYYDVIHKTKG